MQLSAMIGSASLCTYHRHGANSFVKARESSRAEAAHYELLSYWSMRLASTLVILPNLTVRLGAAGGLHHSTNPMKDVSSSAEIVWQASVKDDTQGDSVVPHYTACMQS